MFEVAELGQKLDKDTFNEREPQIREALLDAQLQLREHPNFSVVIVIAGAEGAGKGDAVNRLLEWLDARGIAVHAMGAPTSEELDRPKFYQFWRRLPPQGSIAVFFGSWYTQPIVDHAMGKIDDGELERRLNRVVSFERMLTNEGVLLLKFWLHISKAEQKKKFKKLEADPDTAWRVTKRDWQFHKTYDKFRDVSSHVLRRSSTGFAPWQIIESHDRRFRDMTLAENTLHAIEHRLHNGNGNGELSTAAPLPPAKTGIIRTLDLSQRLDRDEYERKLEKYQGRLGRLARRMHKKNAALVAVFEGSDAAGKGGSIRRLVQSFDARFYNVIPISAPTDEEKARPYLWRFWRHLPRRGHTTIYDRSWYGRVLVERVEGFCGQADWQRAYSEINAFEEQLVESRVVVVKFWLQISADEQLKRFQHRESTGYKRHKLTPEDWRNREKWDQYEAAVCDMIERTSTELAPWTLVEAEDKLFARIKVLETVCDRLEEAVGKDKRSGK